MNIQHIVSHAHSIADRLENLSYKSIDGASEELLIIDEAENIVAEARMIAKNALSHYQKTKNQDLLALTDSLNNLVDYLEQSHGLPPKTVLQNVHSVANKIGKPSKK